MDGLHLTTAHNSMDVRIFDKEAKSLADAGFEVGIVAHDAPTEAQSGVEFFSLGTVESRRQRWMNIRKTARIAKEVGASVYHIHDPELLPVGVYLSQTTESAVIYDVHEDFGHIASMRDWIPKPARPVLSKSVPLLERASAKRFDAVVTVSDWIGEHFVGTVDNVYTVHNFPRTASMPEIGSDCDIEPNAHCTLCYVGGLVGVRGIHDMLKLLNFLVRNGTDAELWALGSWMPDVDRDRAEDYIRSNNLETKVRFPGHVDRVKMFQYLNAADVGLALLDTEHYTNGIPTKLFEYLYAGIPVISTPIDAVDRYLPEQYGFVIPQGDVEAAAEAVKEALEQDYDKTAMRTLVEKNYSWEREAEKLVELYRVLIR